MEQITLGAGCFWCTEAVFASLKGVAKVESGYTGGNTKNPSYDEVCGGASGHAEVARITFDPAVLPLRELLTVFFHLHDPTTLNRQGADVGTQYRSAIFFNSEDQAVIAREVKAQIEREKLWGDKRIVTEISKAPEFYPAEEYHQDYFRRNPNQPYCMFVTRPKVEKLRAGFKEMLKE